MNVKGPINVLVTAGVMLDIRQLCSVDRIKEKKNIS